MRNIPITLIILFVLLFAKHESTMTPITVTGNDIIDPDLFKTELQGAVMEFIEDADLDPDSCYIPFK